MVAGSVEPRTALVIWRNEKGYDPRVAPVVGALPVLTA